MCTTGTGKTLQLFLAFSKYTLEIILFNLIKNDCFLLENYCFLFIHIFVTHFLKCIQNILKLYLVEYACWFKQLGCFKSFHVPYIPQAPSENVGGTYPGWNFLVAGANTKVTI